MSAVISDDGVYRYRLDRRVMGTQLSVSGGNPNRPLAFCMLNPSTADAEVDDATIRRCLDFARRENATHLTVVNVYAYRSKNPKLLLTAKDPWGPQNNQHLRDVAKEAGRVVCAWGNNASTTSAKAAARLMQLEGASLWCLGTTNIGAPKHPLYLKKTAPLIPWSPR